MFLFFSKNTARGSLVIIPGDISESEARSARRVFVLVSFDRGRNTADSSLITNAVRSILRCRLHGT